MAAGVRSTLLPSFEVPDPDLGRFLSRREAPPGANNYTNGDATAELINPSIPEVEFYDDSELILDTIQAGIGVLGMIPIVGIAFDVGNAGLYAARGKWDEVAFSLVSAIPLGGDMVGGANLARKGLTMAAKHAAQNAAAQGVAKLINPERDFSAGQVFGAALTGGIASSAAVKFGRSIGASGKGMAVRRGALAAGSGLVDGVAEAGGQLIDNGGDFGAVDWMQVTMNASMGALGAAVGQRYYDATCFRVGTPMRWEHGHKTVEHFGKKERLYARNEFDPNGPLELKEIEEVFVRQAIILELTVGGQAIGTTAEHPFYAYGKGWTPAHELVVGDLLATADQRWLPVEKLYNTGHVETVYNFRIADHHTYFVGDEDWGFELWVHNAYQIKNKVAGDRREQAELADLQNKHPDASVQRERFLRDASGKIVRDKVTGEGRRIDFAVIEAASVRELVETTSLTAKKFDQISKEKRIRAAGGTYIKDRVTRQLLDVSAIKTTISRRA